MNIKQQSRLFYSKEFYLVFANCQKKNIGQGLLGVYKPNCYGYPRLGMSIKKKNIRKAVCRNKIKRQIRESFYRVNNYLLAYDFIILSTRNLKLIEPKNLLMDLDNFWLQFKMSGVCITGKIL